MGVEESFFPTRGGSLEGSKAWGRPSAPLSALMEGQPCLEAGGGWKASIALVFQLRRHEAGVGAAGHRSLGQEGC